MGRVTALSHFISGSAETAMPIFGTLKKRGKFAWTSECEEAFLQLKAMLASPLVLTRPIAGTPLYLYIFVFDTAISAVLIQEREGDQRPVYFISKVLQGSETRYQKIEKAALALVITSRRLRPYFQNFDIVVRMDLPIRQVLRKPDLAGRMVAWSVQLLEFDISFERRGSGAGIILEGPVGIIIEQYLHFDFKASNNQAEYEALLVGMRLAKKLEAKKLTAKSDSKLVIGQVNREYQARDPQLLKYWERAIAMASVFKNFTLIHVPRDQNEQADLLAKLASTQRRGQ
ncbi:rnhA, partial [Mucuna pruriens]